MLYVIHECVSKRDLSANKIFVLSSLVKTLVKSQPFVKSYTVHGAFRINMFEYNIYLKYIQLYRYMGFACFFLRFGVKMHASM